MTEEKAKEMYFELMDLLAISVKKNKSEEESDLIKDLNDHGYEI